MSLFLRSLQILVNSLGPDHPDIATRLHKLAMLLQAQVSR